MPHQCANCEECPVCGVCARCCLCAEGVWSLILTRPTRKIELVQVDRGGWLSGASE